MAIKHVYALAGLAILAAGLLGRVTAQENISTASMRVAVCNVGAVFNNYERAKDLTTELERKRTTLNAEDTRRNVALETLQANLEKLMPGSAAYDAKLEELERQMLELKTWREFEEARLLREHRQLTEQMYREILKVIDEQAQVLGYQLVMYRDDLDLRSNSTPELLNKIAQRKVLYNSPSIDITDAVLARLNEKYQAGR